MVITFINPPIEPYRKIMRNFDCATESKGNYLYQPYDFLLMSARVPESWSLFLIDAIAECQSPDEVWKQLEEQKPDFLVLSMADTNWAQDLQFLRQLKQKRPKARIYVCGDAFWEASACREVEDHCTGIIDNAMTVDFGALVDRPREAEGLRRSPYEKKPVKKPLEVSLGLPRHSLFLNNKYRWPFARHFSYTTIFTAWGCPYSCSYCVMSNFPNIWRPAEEVLREMREVKKLGLREIYIGDRSFGLPTKNCKEILNGMIAEQMGFRWSTYFRVDQYEPELLELMAASGCHTIIVGFESANHKTLQFFHRLAKPDLMTAMVEHARRLKINICGDFIIGLPGDSVEDVEKTIDWSKRLGIQYASFNVATPLAGTAIRDWAQGSGRIENGGHGYDTLGGGDVLGSDQISPEITLQLRNRAVLQFYLRPLFLIQHLLRLRSWEHLCIQWQEALQILKKVIWGIKTR